MKYKEPGEQINCEIHPLFNIIEGEIEVWGKL